MTDSNLRPVPKFWPQQYVMIDHLGFRERGRVTAIQLDRGGWSYQVEVCVDSDIKRRWFLDDELIGETVTTPKLGF